MNPESLPRISWAGLMELLISYGTKVAGAIILGLVALWLSAKVRDMVERSMERAKLDKTLTRFAANVTRWIILVLAAVSILGMFGVQTASFAALVAASGLAIGLAFQGSLSNLAAGVMLLIFRPFKVGQVVNVAGSTGTVYEIDLFSTKLDTGDNRRLILPNSAVFGAVIENFSHHSTRRIDLPVAVPHGADLDLTREVLLRAVRAENRLLEGDKAPQVVLDSLGPTSVNWLVLAWVKSEDMGAVKQNLLVAIKRELDRAGIGVPGQVMDLRVRSLPREFSAEAPH